MSAPRFRILTTRDDVAVAVDAAKAGTVVALEGKTLTLLEDIPAGHKVALHDIPAGSPVVKYGYPIGSAKTAIPAGSWIHSTNVKTNLEGTLEYSYRGPAAPWEGPKSDFVPTFMGYRRSDGRVGVRNEIWIIPTVGCVNGVVQKVVDTAKARFAGKIMKTDGLFTFTHPYGCSQLGEDHEATRNILANLVKHPNAGGVLVLGLGCENNTIESFKKLVGDCDHSRVKFLVAQECEDEVEQAVETVELLVSHALKDRREPVPASELVVGMKCGGSDGFSGITANPLIGTFTDRIVALGGSSILSEVPEMFGAETILMDRAASREVFDDTVKLINDFKDYFIRHNQVVYENPSPGNKAGGITTLEDKSLGCVQKGGTAPVSGVYPYGGRIDKKGLLLLSGPGNDIVSTTALAAAGAQIVLFSTGRGTPVGGPVPTIKVSSNSDLARRKANWIDFDAGPLLDAGDSKAAEAVEDAFFRKVLEVASGSPTRNELNGYREIAILKDGVTL
jgi:altronate hydrolase